MSTAAVEQKQIPLVRGLPVVGSVAELARDPQAFFVRNYLEHGPVYRVRALNRTLGWQLPTDGPKTLNGLLVEKLETLPEAGDRVEVGEYQFEVLQIGENTIRTVRARRASASTPA